MSTHTSNAFEPVLLNLALRGDACTPPARVFLGLIIALADDGDTFAEVSVAGYARRPATFAAASAGVAALDAPVRFAEATSG